ncbi:hypothetical protein ACFC4G_32210 [Streptomyces sp. NPDC056002]|uniref:hypothetical protein n=1 Tax=Streptomyces sp. NPDC056002 TaxID=3345675 RepID=UPI0035DFB465
MSDLQDAAAAHARRQREETDAAAAVADTKKAAADRALEVRLRDLAGPGREFFALARSRGEAEAPSSFRSTDSAMQVTYE